MTDSQSEASDTKHNDALDSLIAAPRRARVNRGYTRFIRYMRFILPLVALAIIILIVTWPEMNETVVPIAMEEIVPEAQITQNELMSPRFESVDQKRQPFTITAQKAYQNHENMQLVRLNKPMADIILKDGSWMAAEADKGTYEQKTEKLYLQGAVQLFHDSGYQLTTDELRINIITQQAWSDQDVYAQGPAGTIKATGLEAETNKGLLIFKGPAILTLNNDNSDRRLGGLLP